VSNTWAWNDKHDNIYIQLYVEFENVLSRPFESERMWTPFTNLALFTTTIRDNSIYLWLIVILLVIAMSLWGWRIQYMLYYMLEQQTNSTFGIVYDCCIICDCCVLYIIVVYYILLLCIIYHPLYYKSQLGMIWKPA
jgi:hypothetical protein